MKSHRQVAHADPTFKEFAARLNLAQGRVVDVPVHEVNLDDPPSCRWAWVALASEYYNKARALVLQNFVEDPENEPVPLWLNTVAQAMLQVVPAERREESGFDRAHRRHQLSKDRGVRLRLRPPRLQF